MSDEEVRPSPRFARLWVYVGIFGLSWVLLHAVGVLDRGSSLTFVVFGLLTVVATIIGIHEWKPQPRWPWITLLVAQALAYAAGIARSLYGTLGDLSAHRSLVPDILALPAYLVLAVSLAGMAGVRHRNREANIDAVLDAAIAALAVLTLAWMYLVEPAINQQHVPLTVRLLLAAYPPASVFVVAMGVRLSFSSSRRPPLALRFVLLAMGFLVIGDVIYMLADAHQAHIPSQLIDVPYALGYVALSVAVLHPSVRRVGQPAPSDEVAPRAARLIFVVLALCVPVIVLLFPGSESQASVRVAVGFIIVLLTGAASVRTYRALRQHARSQERLAHQATHDPLTGLPNRVYVLEHLDRVLAGNGRSVAVLFIDLDRFKLVNDTMGHGVGDQVLISVARRLGDNVRERDLVARVGGDEFMVVIEDLSSESQAREFAERTRLGFKYALSAGDVDLTVTASVGVSFAQLPAKDLTGEAMLRDADTAMSHAKDAGRDTVAVFDASMRERVAERLMLERELRHALDRDELEVYYQPKVRTSDYRVVGMEALLRWHHPTLGSVRPDLFIPIAEDTGMIVEIGAWVLDQACAMLARLRDGLKNPDELRVSVNLSVRQLRDDAVMDHVARALLRHGLPGDALCLELTESMLMENFGTIGSQLDAIRGCGVKLSIDDFGTGYSSLAYLRKLAVDEVKIDRTFVNDLSDDGAGASVVAAVVAIAGSLGITTCAEGVETEDQAEALRGLGCTEAQGYLFSRPVPGSQIATVLDQIGMVSGPRLRVISSA